MLNVLLQLVSPAFTKYLPSLPLPLLLTTHHPPIPVLTPVTNHRPPPSHAQSSQTRSTQVLAGGFEPRSGELIRLIFDTSSTGTQMQDSEV